MTFQAFSNSNHNFFCHFWHGMVLLFYSYVSVFFFFFFVGKGLIQQKHEKEKIPTHFASLVRTRWIKCSKMLIALPLICFCFCFSHTFYVLISHWIEKITAKRFWYVLMNWPTLENTIHFFFFVTISFLVNNGESKWI